MMVSKIDEAVEFLRSGGMLNPEVGIILGTGLGNRFVKEITNPVVISYNDIPHFPEATVESHHGKLVYGKMGGKNVIAMQGRFHYYEGYGMDEITLPVRVMRRLGIKALLISNAAGNLNRSWKKGEMMLLDDHINLQAENPLRGPNMNEFGPRFPDMSQPYSRRLNEKLALIAGRQGTILNIGVYASVAGPNLETRAEYRFLQRIGADAVGMSTVPEVIVANHMGLECCAISVLTDDCDPDHLKSVSLAEIVAVANDAEPKLTSLFIELIKEL